MSYDPATIEAFRPAIGGVDYRPTITDDADPNGGAGAGAAVPVSAPPPTVDPAALELAKRAYPNSPQKWPGYVPPSETAPTPPPRPALPADADEAMRVAAAAYPNNPEKWGDAAEAIRKQPRTLDKPKPSGESKESDAQAIGRAANIDPASLQLDRSLVSAPRYLPGHFDYTRVGITPRHLEDQRDAIRHEGQVAQSQANIMSAGQDLEAQQLQSHANWLADQNNLHQRNEIVRQQRYDELRNRAQKLADDASKQTIDPGRIFHGESGGVMGVAAVIGGALGGWLVGAHGGENQFIKQLNAVQDKDIDAQRSEIEQGHYKAGMAKNALADLRDQLGDERLAEETLRARQLNYVLTKIKNIQASTTSKFTKTMADKAIADTEGQLAELNGRIDRAAYVPAQVVGGGGTPINKLNVVTLANGKSYAFQNDADRSKVQERLLAQQDLGDIYLRVKSLRQKMGKLNPIADAKEFYKTRAELDSLAERALPAWSISKGQGQVKEEEAARYKKNLFPFASYFDPAADSIIDAGVRENEQNVDNILRAHGGEEVQTGYALDKAGNLEPTAVYTGQRVNPKPKANPGSFKSVGSK